jgi:hypothetical protein
MHPSPPAGRRRRRTPVGVTVPRRMGDGALRPHETAPDHAGSGEVGGSRSLSRDPVSTGSQYQPLDWQADHAPQGVPYDDLTYDRPHAICVAGLSRQSAPILPIFEPGSACGIP